MKQWYNGIKKKITDFIEMIGIGLINPIHCNMFWFLDFYIKINKVIGIIRKLSIDDFFY